MQKQAVSLLSIFVICIAVLSFASSAAVPDIGASSCVTYEQARAQGIKGTDAELRSMGFCAGTGTSTQTAAETTAASDDYENAQVSSTQASSGESLAGMTFEQMFAAETRSNEEVTAELDRISAEFKDDYDFIGSLWEMHFAKSDEASEYNLKVTAPELDALTQRSIDCTSQCSRSYSSDIDAWKACSDSCNKIYNEEYLDAIRKDIEFSIQKDKEAINEINQMAAEKRGHEAFKSDVEYALSEAEGIKFRQDAEEALAEAEQVRVKEELKAAIASVEKERTQANVEAAIAEAEMNNAAGLLSQKSGSVGITKPGMAAEWARSDSVISIGDIITTGKNSAVKTQLAEGSEVYIGENSEVKYGNPFEEGIELVLGKIKLFVEKQKANKFVRIKSHNAAISVRATEFVVEYNKTSGTTSVYLHNGTVEVESASGTTLLEAGNVLVIGKGSEPVISGLDEQSWLLMGNEFAGVGKYPLWAFFAWLTGGVIILSVAMSASVVHKEKSKKSKLKSQRNLGLVSLIFGIIGIVTSLLPIIGGPVSITGVALAKIQRMRKKTFVSAIGLVLSCVGIAFSLLIWLSVYFNN